MSEVLKQALEFKKKYPSTIAWRIPAHAKIVEKHMNPGEKVIYTFMGQKKFEGITGFMRLRKPRWYDS